LFKWIFDDVCVVIVVLVHNEGTVPLKVLLNGSEIGMRSLVYYSLTSTIITGISQIYLAQLTSLLGALLRPGPASCHPEVPTPASQVESTRDEIGGEAESATSEWVWNAPTVDQLMTKLFIDDYVEQIPMQAFEQIFSVYSQQNTGNNSRLMQVKTTSLSPAEYIS
jgi:hypothetical protein